VEGARQLNRGETVRAEYEAITGLIDDSPNLGVLIPMISPSELIAQAVEMLAPGKSIVVNVGSLSDLTVAGTGRIRRVSAKRLWDRVKEMLLPTAPEPIFFMEMFSSQIFLFLNARRMPRPISF